MVSSAARGSAFWGAAEACVRGPGPESRPAAAPAAAWVHRTYIAKWSGAPHVVRAPWGHSLTVVSGTGPQSHFVSRERPASTGLVRGVPGGSPEARVGRRPQHPDRHSLGGTWRRGIDATRPKPYTHESHSCSISFSMQNARNSST